MKLETRIVLTEDGSHTLYVDSLDEYYHSRYGAIQESEHIFISKGLDASKKKDIAILEVGFGTGLNALLTYLYGKKNHMKIQYDAIELYPLEDSLIQQLNFSRLLDIESRQLLLDIHKCSWNQVHFLDDDFAIRKMLQDFSLFKPKSKYELVYFDAFSPEKQPEMWNEQNFRRLFQAMQIGGMLVTYCAKGEIKRRLKRIGFKVELLKGPPGKHQMIRAVKPG